MAAVAAPLQPFTTMQDERVMDTRTPSPLQRTESGESKDGDYKPDLSAEVALLSTKLVNAINYNTNLDDTLQASQHKLEQYSQRCADLELEKQRHEAMVSGGVLVKKSDMDKTIMRLRTELASEKAARDVAEKAKKQTEGELENLTSALFEEANSMVAMARKDTENVERRNTQLKGQLEDMELLLSSQQEQLQDLKTTMEKLQESSAARDPSIPSTPINTAKATFEAFQRSPTPGGTSNLTPEHPLHFSQLISPVLNTDTTAFGDFQDLLLLAKRLGAHSRNTSGTGGQLSSGHSTYANIAASSSSPNLPGAFSFSTNSSPASNYGGGSFATIPPLKESKFYKRVLTEDIEPTLRLDLAPGLSFLSRRTVLASLLAGTLAVEPYPQNKGYFACTLCGENRRTEQYQRKYRFRTSEDDTVSKPLCDYCVSRLRATCDFVGFLRMVRDGHWKCETEEDEKTGWEESVRLRERMFWTRLGGGVIPCLQLAPRILNDTPFSTTVVKSGRPSLESISEGSKSSGRASKAPAESDVFQEKPKIAVAEMQPPKSPEPGFITPPPTGHLEEEDASAAATQPTTPFEDPAQELGLSSPEIVTDADGQLKRELNAQASLPEQDSAIDDTPERTRPASSMSGKRLQPPLTMSQESSPRTSLSVEPSAHERKNSVLERVRAMEASRAKK